MTSPTEQDVVSILRTLTRGRKFSRDLRDDVASMPTMNNSIVSTDSVVQGWHIVDNAHPEQIASKLLCRNISDIASKGCKPLCYTLNLFLTHKQDFQWIHSFAHGLLKTQSAIDGLFLLGGDTVFLPSDGQERFIVSATIFGQASESLPQGKTLDRANAVSGDGIFCTGSIGMAYLGYHELMKNIDHSSVNVERYVSPVPNFALWQEIAKIANATCDISDGIIADLRKICNASNVKYSLWEDKIPLAKGARLDFGDDYELLFTAPIEAVNASNTIKPHVTQIGIIL